MERRDENLIILTKEQNEKEFELLQKITKTFKVKNITTNGDTMLIDLTNARISEGPQTKLIPAGNYNAVISTCELRDTKDGTGKYLRTMWKVTDEICKNRTVFHNFNIQSTNPKAQEVGIGYVKKLFILNNRTSFVLQTPADLIGMKAKVFIKTKQSSIHGDQNIIVNFAEYEGLDNIVAPNLASSQSNLLNLGV